LFAVIYNIIFSAAEIAAELEQDESKASMDNVATVKHLERNYMGMLEYKKDDEPVLIKNLIMGELSPLYLFKA